jgi:hypothetical protein
MEEVQKNSSIERNAPLLEPFREKYFVILENEGFL